MRGRQKCAIAGGLKHTRVSSRTHSCTFSELTRVLFPNSLVYFFVSNPRQWRTFGDLSCFKPRPMAHFFPEKYPRGQCKFLTGMGQYSNIFSNCHVNAFPVGGKISIKSARNKKVHECDRQNNSVRFRTNDRTNHFRPPVH